MPFGGLRFALAVGGGTATLNLLFTVGWSSVQRSGKCCHTEEYMLVLHDAGLKL